MLWAEASPTVLAELRSLDIPFHLDMRLRTRFIEVAPLPPLLAGEPGDL